MTTTTVTEFFSFSRQAFFIEYSNHLPHPREYFIDVEGDFSLGENLNHLFCGENEIKGAWCPNCDKPLIKLLSLDATDVRLSSLHLRFDKIALFYCFRCNITNTDPAYSPFAFGGYLAALFEANKRTEPWCLTGDTPEIMRMWGNVAPFYYQVIDVDEIVLLQYGHGLTSDEEPYENYPYWFPEAHATLVEISPETQSVIGQLNTQEIDVNNWLPTESAASLAKPIHQVGGEPYLVQSSRDAKMTCPLCHSVMPFLAAIADDCLDVRGFTQLDYLQLLYHYCRQCNVIGVINQVS